jgi:DnaA family protein
MTKRLVTGQGQLALPLAIREKPGFDQFIIGDNIETVQLLKLIAGGIKHTRLLLWGSHGCGVSHLLQASCILADEKDQAVAYIPLGDYQQLDPVMFEDLDQMIMVCIDDIDAIAGDLKWETALFHLYNRLREKDISLLMTAHSNPRNLDFKLPDLKSRMVWDLVYHLRPLADTDKIEALQRRAHARGFRLPREVAEFLVNRVQRDMPSLMQLLDQLEQATLTAQRKLTIPFARSFLENR